MAIFDIFVVIKSPIVIILRIWIIRISCVKELWYHKTWKCIWKNNKKIYDLAASSFGGNWLENEICWSLEDHDETRCIYRAWPCKSGSAMMRKVMKETISCLVASFRSVKTVPWEHWWSIIFHSKLKLKWHLGVWHFLDIWRWWFLSAKVHDVEFASLLQSHGVGSSHLW